MIIDPDDHPDRHSTDKVKQREAFADGARRLRDDVLTDPTVRKVHVMVGPPGSGKSTWAKEHRRDNHPQQREWTKERVPPFERTIVDGCHATAPDRRALAAQIKAAGKVPIAVHMKTPAAECLRRNNKRQPPKRVSRQVIDRQHFELAKRPPRKVEGWAEVIEVES